MEFRRLRRADLSTFFPVLHLGLGELEHATGLDQDADTSYAQLSRRSTWALLRLLRILGRSPVEIYVAADGPRVVGTGTLLLLPQAGYVVGMSTDPGFRGRGIASRILALGRAEAVRRHRAWMALDVESENDTAIRVYRRAGYREVGRSTWFRRPGVPDPVSLAPEGSGAASSRELTEVLPHLEAGRPTEYRAALPASPRTLSHIEIIIRGSRSRQSSWVRRGTTGTVVAVRAHFVPRTRMGVYIPLAGTTEGGSVEMASALDAATQWLRPQSPVSCLAVVPEPVGPVGGALESRGFRAVVSSTTMVCPVSPSTGSVRPG